MFSTSGYADLSVPVRWLDDGPMGVRAETGRNGGDGNAVGDSSTAFPCGIGIAATWDPAMAFLVGQSIGEEALARKKDIMLGPGVNIMRTPLNGRNFEYYGEDPYLASRMAVAYIEGEQSEDIASCVKHFALNNQEAARNSINVEVDERALREIYLPAFEAAVKEAKVWSVMASYNKVRGNWAAENEYLLNKVLKGEWGFQGIVISDWGAAHTLPGSALGLDLEMNVQGTNYVLGPRYLEGLLDGTYPVTEADRAKLAAAGQPAPPSLDDKATRNLRVMIATKVLDPDRKTGSILTPAHLDASRRVAEAGMVLLQNKNNALPLEATKLTKVAVIGDNAIHLQAAGGQSSGIKTPDEVAPLAAIKQLLGDKVEVNFYQGYLTPAKNSGGRGRGRGGAATTTPQPNAQQLADEAVAGAKAADVVIFVGGLNKNFDTEGGDRPDLKLPGGQDTLIQAVMEANPRTIVVLVAGSPVEMPWLEKAPAVLFAWYGGTQAGDAVANVLFGKVNPSGKLPCTFPKQLADSPVHAQNLYVTQNAGTEPYSDGIFVGYRYFDSKKDAPAPLFPFGYGLSYTTFAYSNMKLVPPAPNDPKGILIKVQYDVQNTGTRAGAEVSQLYVKDVASSLERPEKELKGFKKVFLQPGEKQTVTLPLDQRSLAFFKPDAEHPDQQGWLAEAGDFQILVGGSSRSLPLSAPYHLAQNSLTK
jgi:beta-glucosidase